MIRLMQPADLQAVLDIWLTANCEAHDFIPREYWEGQYEAVRRALPDAAVWLYADDGRIAGFLGVVDGYIAGLFVDGAARSRGIGTQLLTHVKAQTDRLTLHVYEKNKGAVRFYQREGFRLDGRRTDMQTGMVEYEMIWIRA